MKSPTGFKSCTSGNEKSWGHLQDGVSRSLTAQVCYVYKSLLSVSRTIMNGHRVTFDEGGGYIEDKATKEKIWMAESKGMHTVLMWIPRQDKKETSSAGQRIELRVSASGHACKPRTWERQYVCRNSRDC